jgi:hypothetical protein
MPQRVGGPQKKSGRMRGRPIDVRIDARIDARIVSPDPPA